MQVQGTKLDELLATMGRFDHLRLQYQITTAKDFFESNEQKGKIKTLYPEADFYEAAGGWALSDMMVSVGIGVVIRGDEPPVQVTGDTIHFNPKLLGVKEVFKFTYLGKEYFIYRPEENIFELYELSED